MPEVTDPLGMLTAAVDALCSTDPARLSDRESISGLYRQLSRLEAATTRATGAFDAHRDWEEDRARTAAGWLAATTHVPKALAQRRVWLGRQLRVMRIEQELFDEDWAEARERVGPGVCAADLRRTAAQRRADALVEMARRSGAVPDGSRLPEPLFSVFVGYETFAGPICELAEGTAVTPGSLLRYLDEAWIERVVFGSPSRVIDIGQKRRLFSGATRRAVQVRDRECFHEFCDLPADDCQVDHIEPFAAGGLTTQDNGRPACGFHNRDRHRRT